MIEYKDRREIGLMRDAGRIVHEVLHTLSETARPGVTTGALADKAEQIINRYGATAMFKGYPCPDGKGPPFPGVICTSVNDEVVHGIPGNRELKDGDIVALDCGVRYRGWCADSATTAAIGKVSDAHRLLLDVTRGALRLAIESATPDGWWSEIARKMQALVEGAGFHVVRDYVGHGIGKQMHEDPKVPNYCTKELRKDDIRLKKGLVVAVEPMVNFGTDKTKTLKDRWTVTTKDGSFSAHFEHTLAFGPEGVEVLTNGS